MAGGGSEVWDGRTLRQERCAADVVDVKARGAGARRHRLARQGISRRAWPPPAAGRPDERHAGAHRGGGAGAVRVTRAGFPGRRRVIVIRGELCSHIAVAVTMCAGSNEPSPAALPGH